MGESYIKALGARQPQRLDPNAFKPKSGGNLDTVSEGNVKGLKADRENALKKIVNYNPIHLKKLGSDIQSSLTKRKQESGIRTAQSAIVKDKVQSIRKENPFSNPIERLAGKNLNSIT